MEEVSKENGLETKSIVDLKARCAVLNEIIKQAKTDGDPRWKEAARQLRNVNKVLVQKIKEARIKAHKPEPEHVRVGMRPVRLKAKRLGM